jgi:hypothetical protein
MHDARGSAGQLGNRLHHPSEPPMHTAPSDLGVLPAIQMLQVAQGHAHFRQCPSLYGFCDDLVAAAHHLESALELEKENWNVSSVRNRDFVSVTALVNAAWETDLYEGLALERLYAFPPPSPSPTKATPCTTSAPSCSGHVPR